MSVLKQILKDQTPIKKLENPYDVSDMELIKDAYNSAYVEPLKKVWKKIVHLKDEIHGHWVLAKAQKMLANKDKEYEVQKIRSYFISFNNLNHNPNYRAWRLHDYHNCNTKRYDLTKYK